MDSNSSEFHKARTQIRILNIKIGNQEGIHGQDILSTYRETIVDFAICEKT